MATNYTEEQVKEMIVSYQEEPTRNTVNNLAQQMDKSIKSIIGKLSREGVYRKAVYKTKTGELPVTKAEIIVELSNVLSTDSAKLMGLEKAPKQDLKHLLEKARILCE